MTTGERIKAARKKAGLTQKELGEKLGVSYQTLAQWENNLRNPKYATLQRIATALDVPVQNLFDDWDSLDPEDVKDEIIFGGPIRRVTENMQQLNLTGRERVASYSEELLKIAEYRLSRPQGAPQSVPPAQEGKDTTPPQKPATGPSDG